MRDEKLDLDAIEADLKVVHPSYLMAYHREVTRLLQAAPALVERVRELEAERAEALAQTGDGWQVTHNLPGRVKMIREAGEHWARVTRERVAEEDSLRAAAVTMPEPGQRLMSDVELAMEEIVRAERERAAAIARAEQAERERDEARAQVERHSKYEAAFATSLTYQKLEAKTAALREALEYALGWLNENTYPSAVSRARAALAPDAGRALLAELAALREVAKFAWHRENCQDPGHCICGYADAIAKAVSR